MQGKYTASSTQYSCQNTYPEFNQASLAVSIAFGAEQITPSHSGLEQSSFIISYYSVSQERRFF